MARRSILLLTLTAACAPAVCEEEPPVVTVTPEMDDEDFRSLPVIASGANNLLGIDVPDSHAQLSSRIRIGGVDGVTITALDLTLEVNGQRLDSRVVRQLLGEQEVEEGDRLRDGNRLRFYLRGKSLADLKQPEGAAYLAELTLSWERDFGPCGVQSGTETLKIEGFVATPVDTGSFRLAASVEAEASPPALTGTGRFRIGAEIDSGLGVELRSISASLTYFSADGLVPGLGIGLFDAPATQVDGQHAAAVAPGEVLQIYSSSSPATDAAPYDDAGTVAATGTVDGGKALIDVAIEYTPLDGTASVQSARLVDLVDLR